MKPYPQTGLTAEQRVFNYRLSRMRRISENAFGLIVNRWRVFRAPINLNPGKVTKITLAALTLHNYLLSEINHTSESHDNSGENAHKGEVVSGGSSWLDFSPRCSNNHTVEAKAIREEFKGFFNNEGAVPWQWKQCGLDRWLQHKSQLMLIRLATCFFVNTLLEVYQCMQVTVKFDRGM